MPLYFVCAIVSRSFMVQLRTKDVNPTLWKTKQKVQIQFWKNRPETMSRPIQWKPVKSNVQVRFIRIYENQKFCVP